MKHRDVVAGFRFFKCGYCKREWKEESRDCQSPSGDYCDDECGYFIHPIGFEKHPEWKTDSFGNLIEGERYE